MRPCHSAGRVPATICLLFAAALLLAGALPAQAIHPLNEGDPTTSGFILYNGIPTIRGWRFVVNAAGVTVTELGCRYPDSTTTAKTITLWALAPTPTALASAAITPGPGWRWAVLTTPIPLTQSAEYTVSAYSSAQMYENNNLPAVSPWKPTGAIQYINLQWQNNPSSPTNFPSSNFGGNSQQGVVDIGYVTGPQFNVAASAGTAQDVYANATGPGGNGIPAATFTITSNSEPGGMLNNILLAASGTGNDATAYAHVAIHRDSNDSAAFEAGPDALIGTAVAAFPSNDGVIDIAVQMAEQAFNTSEARRYFVVVKLSGAAQPGDTFNFTVQDILVSGANATALGVPSGVMNGLNILGPAFVFADASPAAAITANLDSTGNVCQQFSITYPAGPDNRPATVTISGTGTGNEAAHVTQVALWHDANDSGGFEPAVDSLVDSGTFSADNGNVTFSMASQALFQSADSRTYFVVYDLNQGALHGQAFKCFVSAAAGAQYGATYPGLPAPGAGGTAGLQVSAVILTAVLNGPTAPLAVPAVSAGPTGDGHLLCDVTLQAREGAPWNLGLLVFAATGMAALDAAFSQVALYEDTGNGVWDGAAGDTLAAAALAAFGPAPAYEAAFALTNDVLPAGGARRFFLVGKLGGGATSSETLNGRLMGITAAPPPGGLQYGMPTAESSALVIGPAALTVTNRAGATNALHKAGTAQSFLLGAFSLGAVNDESIVSSITLTMTGSGNWAASMESANGIEVFRDDGDLAFTPASDALVYQGPGAQVAAVPFAAMAVPAGGRQDIWVRVNVAPGAAAGALAPQTFSLTIAQASDVAASTPVAFGVPAPQGAILTVVNFTVTDFDPSSATTAGGAPITITGTGFLAPFTVTINGAPCGGAAAVTPGQVTGLSVPPGSGSNLPIVVTNGGLPPETLSQTFSYGVNAGGGGSRGSDGGCAAGLNTLVPLAMLAVLWRRGRRG